MGLNKNLVTTVRILMGVIYLVSGVNWWFKMITPYPSISDFVTDPPPPDMVGAMIETGVFFHIVKGTELVAGLALLSNRFVPLMMVAVMPITFSIFIVDVFFIAHLRGIIMGTGSLVLNVFMLLVLLGHYRGMLTVTATPDLGADAAPAPDSASIAPLLARLSRHLTPVLGWVALLFALAMMGYIVTLMIEYAQNPLPLSALHPPPKP